MDTLSHRKEREKMVEEQIQNRGISDPAVLHAMKEVPRHLFIPESIRHRAYGDHPLPIGEGQTISQPYIVALMTEKLNLKDTSRVLEIGTGSGYQAAILSKITKSVYTIEIKKTLYENASKNLNLLGFSHINVRHGDGYFGWEEAQPFDAIMITAAVDHVPPPLIKHLSPNGRLILPLGNPFSYQNLVLITRKGNDLVTDQICGVLFVPLTGYSMKKK
jgi:protein-L-isoaspartate(D-aspartate) O-methyltransferase